MNYQISTSCEKGNFRSNNEDAISYGFNEKLNITWLMVADGMGGHLAGEVASGLFINYIEQQIAQLETAPQSSWCEWITKQINSANEIIFDHAKTQKQCKGMGTTGVLAIFDKQQSSIGWVGDSRAYLLRNGELSLQTEDHTMIQYLLNKGAITAIEAENSNTKNLLSRAIGSKQYVEVDTISYNAVDGDTVMLSTDGLHDYLSQKEITKHMGEFASLCCANVSNENAGMSICKKMTAQAIKQLSKDNVTLGLIAMTE